MRVKLALRDVKLGAEEDMDEGPDGRRRERHGFEGNLGLANIGNSPRPVVGSPCLIGADLLWENFLISNIGVRTPQSQGGSGIGRSTFSGAGCRSQRICGWGVAELVLVLCD